MSVLDRMRGALSNYFNIGQGGSDNNLYNQAFFWAGQGGFTTYDVKAKSYIEKGYNINPIVYSVVQQMAVKTASVPIYVKEVEDDKAYQKLNRLRNQTSRGGTVQQKARMAILEGKAFQEAEFALPLDQPNPSQTWIEFLQLSKTFLRTTGNIYYYIHRGDIMKEPVAIYVLPSHQMQIILKANAPLLGIEDPIKEYMLIEGHNFVRFQAEDVIHVKYPNPNFDHGGSHLYGLSPLQSALKNIESSNNALNLNIGTMKSGGAFGFIHAKGTPLTEAQAKEVKSRLVEMKADPGELGKIAGISAEMGFTRISLSADELRPFDYLKFDQKQICNVLGWSDSLLNNDDGGKYDKQLQERKRVVTDNIVPDLDLIMNALNKKFLKTFKGYENLIFQYDIMELPEMQDDATLISEWLYAGLDRGVFSRNEVRRALRWEEVPLEGMDAHTLDMNIMTVEEAIENDLSLGKQEEI